MKYSFFFENVDSFLLPISRTSLQTPSLDDIRLGNFTLPNSIILVEDLIRGERGFEIFLTTMLVILAITTSLVSIKKNLVSVSLMLYYTDQCMQGAVSIIPWFINVCIIYLHVIENCLNVTIAMFYFCHSKNPSNIMKNIFNSVTIYS